MRYSTGRHRVRTRSAAATETAIAGGTVRDDRATSHGSVRTSMRRGTRLAAVALVGVALGLAAYAGWRAVARATPTHRTTPVYDPPVLAGQPVWGYCSGGIYARLGERIVLTSTGHCAPEGTVATDPDGVGVRGVFGPPARDATCPYPGHVCASSDINYLVVAPNRIPWGHLNLVDMGSGGYRT